MTSHSDKSSETIKKIDDNFRHQSHKLMDKFRKIRHPSRLINENGRKLSDTDNNIVEKGDNQSSAVPKLFQDASGRRRSTITTPEDYQLPAMAPLKPKGILKPSTPNNSSSNINLNSSQDHHKHRRIDLLFHPRRVNKSENIKENLSSSLSDSDSSNQSSEIATMKMVKHVKFHDSFVCDNSISMSNDIPLQQTV